MVYEKVIRSCFSNLDRKKYPNFMRERNWEEASSLHTINEEPEYWIDLINPQLQQEFNSSKIHLHNTRRLWEKTEKHETVDIG